MTLMWHARRINGRKRPRAAKRRHCRVGAASTQIWLMTRSSGFNCLFSVAFATAEAITLLTGSAAAFDVKRSSVKASIAFLPRTRSTTKRTFCGDMPMYRTEANA